MSLLEPDEPQPVHVERADSDSPFLFACDHAGRRMPRALGDLGLAAEHFERHIAYDVGIEPVARRLAAALDAPLVAQSYSRLVIDCNRPTHVPASIPTISEATPIPATKASPARSATPGSTRCTGRTTTRSKAFWKPESAPACRPS